MPQILDRKQQSLFLDITIQHHFRVCLFKWQLSKKTADSEAEGGNQDVLCLVLQSKTNDSDSSGYTITGIISALFAFKKFQ